jgi:hypothetical protein
MIVYTYSEARRNLASLPDKAVQEGEVGIKSEKGQIFVIRPQPHIDSPLNVEGVDLDITTPEIIQMIQEGRRTF